MASKGINVKIERTKLIKELTNVLSEMQKSMDSYEIEYADYEIKHKKWEQIVAKQALKMGIGEVRVGSNWRSDRNIEMSWTISSKDLPEEPKIPDQPYRPTGYGKNYVGNFQDRKAEILNAIRILEMSEDEFVNASSYGAVSKYL